MQQNTAHNLFRATNLYDIEKQILTMYNNLFYYIATVIEFSYMYNKTLMQKESFYHHT